jgi:hypothetical protein
MSQFCRTSKKTRNNCRILCHNKAGITILQSIHRYISQLEKSVYMNEVSLYQLSFPHKTPILYSSL